jgi:outer membrane murein-binding lipoprotein Lpp
MPKITEQGGVFRDWEAVLGACTQNAALVPGVDSLKADLDRLLTQAKDLKVQQETFEGMRQAMTQQLKKALEDGREVARKIRAFAVVQLGSDNKHLTQFGVTPRQRRPRKSKSPETPPPTTGPTGPPVSNSPKP